MAAQSTDTSRSKVKEAEQFGGYSPKPGDHQFIKAFLSGDLAALELCLENLGGATCGFPGRPSKVSIEQWVKHFGEMAAGSEVTGLGALSASQLARAFTCLKQLSARPRLELHGRCLEEEDSEWLLVGDFEEARCQVALAQALGQRLVRGTAAAPEASQVAETTAAEFVLAANKAVAMSAAAVAIVEHRKVSMHRHRQMSLSAAVPYTLEVVLDGVSPAMRLARAAVRNAKHGIYSEVCADLHLLWSLLALEPATTLHACLLAEPPAAELLGFLLRRAARSLVEDEAQGKPSNPDMVWALVLTLRICGDLASVHKVAGVSLAAKEESRVLLGRAIGPSSGIKEAFRTKDPKVTQVQVMKPGAAGPERPGAKGRVADSPWLVLQVLQERSVAVAMAPLAILSSYHPGAVSLLGAAWELLDRCSLPGAVTVRPALRHLAAAAGLQPAGQQLKSKKLLRPKTAEELLALEAGSLKPKAAGYTETKRAFLPLAVAFQRSRDGSVSDRKRCSVLFGAVFIAERAVKEQIRVYGKDKEADACGLACRQLFDELKPSFKALVKRETDKGQHASEKSPSSRRRVQIAGDVAKEAEIKEMRRSCFAADEQWFELLSLEDESDDDASDAASEAASLAEVTSVGSRPVSAAASSRVEDLLQ